MSTKIELNEKNIRNLITGGCILGGGGGGSIAEGLKVMKDILKYPTINLSSIDKYDDDDLIVCASLVGAPAAKDKYISNDDCIDVVKYFVDNYNIKGVITNENGGLTSINGLLACAFLGLDFIDYPCNGRAHPTGMMGALMLHTDNSYNSIQVASGGKGSNKQFLVSKGSIFESSTTIRNTAVKAGGLVSVARNPITVSYLKKHGARNALSWAIELGNIFNDAIKDSSQKAVEKTVEYLSGEIICVDKVNTKHMICTNGFDYGKITIGGYDISFWNEYMNIDKNEKRIATFPDLVMTFDYYSGLPITSAEIEEGQLVYLIKVPKNVLILSSTMKDTNILKSIEDALNIEIIKHL